MIETHQEPLSVYIRLVAGLAVLILIGAGLLMLPGVSAERPLPFMDALFTATSALTVTGLTVVTTSIQFTPAGKWLILLLIQIGGVGYMAVVAVILRFVGRRISLVNRLALSSSLGLDRPTNILRVLRRTLLGILIIEGLGALLLLIHWQVSGTVPPENAFLFAMFHAVSAFCNAGFDLFAGQRAYPGGIPADSTSLVIMGTLIVTGGMGIPVLTDLFSWRTRRRLVPNTRVTLGIAAFLILVGWLGLYLIETRSGGVLYNAPLEQKLVHTWFQSVSARTAGFPGFRDFTQISPPAQLLLMALMFIGCAPASMGGGITTGTFAVLVLALISYGQGLPTAHVGRHAIAANTVRRAAAVLTVAIGVVMLATWLLLMTHDFTMNEALFEVISAFATCGLSLGVTTELNVFGRILIMFMMFWGRLGALTLIIVFTRQSKPAGLMQYPETTILIG